MIARGGGGVGQRTVSPATVRGIVKLTRREAVPPPVVLRSPWGRDVRVFNGRGSRDLVAMGILSRLQALDDALGRLGENIAR